MQNENPQVQMRKGVLELCILRILSHGEAYTSDLSDRLKQAELLVVEGTLYPLLTRMKNAGWLVYRWEESKNGPPRKYYALTKLGVQQLELLDREWESFVEAVQSLNRPEMSKEPDSGIAGEPNPPQAWKPATGQPREPNPPQAWKPDSGQPREPNPRQAGEPDSGQPGEPNARQVGKPDSGQPREPNPTQAGKPDSGEAGEPMPAQPNKF